MEGGVDGRDASILLGGRGEFGRRELDATRQFLAYAPLVIRQSGSDHNKSLALCCYFFFTDDTTGYDGET